MTAASSIAAQIQRALAPADILEQVFVRTITLAAVGLQQIADRVADDPGSASDPSTLRTTRQFDQILQRNLRSLEKYRKAAANASATTTQDEQTPTPPALHTPSSPQPVIAPAPAAEEPLPPAVVTTATPTATEPEPFAPLTSDAPHRSSIRHDRHDRHSRADRRRLARLAS